MRSFKEYIDSQQTSEQVLPTQFIVYPNFQGCDPAKNLVGQKLTLNTKDTLGNEPGKDYGYFTTEKGGYVEKMIKDAQGEKWKTFEPISAIKHPILKGKYLAIDGNHRLGAFKIGQIPQINAIIIGYENILLATPDTKWSAGVVPKTIPLQSAINNKNVDLKTYFNTRDLQVPQQQVPQQQVPQQQVPQQQVPQQQVPQQQVPQQQASQQQVSSRIYDEPILSEWLVLSGLCEQNVDINTIVQQYLNSDIGRKYQNHDCKSVTRAFIQWAEKNGMQAQALHLAPPSAEFVQKNPQFKGKSGEGDSHIMPVINGYAVDFTARQFGLNRPYNNPLITPISQVKSTYGKFGYYTDNPDWFSGGKSFHLGSWESMPTIDTGFQDEIL